MTAIALITVVTAAVDNNNKYVADNMHTANGELLHEPFAGNGPQRARKKLLEVGAWNIAVGVPTSSLR